MIKKAFLAKDKSGVIICHYTETGEHIKSTLYFLLLRGGYEEPPMISGEEFLMGGDRWEEIPIEEAMLTI